jgi:hypothetical protein
MFPLLPVGSANTALKRLLDAINKAADAEQIPLRAEITADKKGGAANRWVWFEGPVPGPALPYTGELSAIPQGQLITDQLGLPQEDRPIIVLITFNEHETVAVTRQFHPDGTPKAETRNSMTYNLLGGSRRHTHRSPSEQTR